MRKKSKSDLYPKAGARIEKLRCEQGYSRGMLADKAEVTEKFIYEIETGKKGFSSEILYRISKVLGVSCDYILCGRRKRKKCNQELLAMIEHFDENEAQRMIQLIKIMHEVENG